MKFLDQLFERSSRRVADTTSRRKLLSRMGSLLVAGAALPVLLPIDRTGKALAADKPMAGDPGDPNSCDYWRYCSIDGFLCNCCGGSVSSCPPGTEVSQVAWVGTCRNPGDGKNYIISYNDCCGKHSCNQCACTRNDSEEPAYRPFNNNDVNWCLAAKSHIYHCTVSVIRGVAV
ncbi:methylamine dehydrogenase light chain [Pseudomonas citronellolis]|uniref:methylamine dehydrogenase light chain n=1 Tax=Pseudomonas citronellolis TaxID=53408 RepID=UPI0023E44150|nr:methylamine dehydrogenase light chain [Pseudomonas citronellolis]MDF3935950.1 methylamine dehydrogenase light chain [Pseudomonas citronellolis]